MDMKKLAGILAALLLLIMGIPAQAAEIHQAVQNGDLAAVKALVEKDNTAVHSRDGDGRTPLHWACRGRNLDIVAYLIEKGADVNARDDNRTAPLHSLAVRNLSEAAALLISQGAEVSILDYVNQTPLHHAAASGHKAVSALLARKGAKLEIKDNWGRTPLLLCARERGGPELAEVLIKAGSDVNARDKYGATSLNLAAWRGKKEVVDVLLAAGAEVPVKGPESRRMAMYAASQGLENLFDRLDSGGADTRFTLQNGGSLLHKAAGGGSVRIIKTLLDGDLDAGQRDRFGWTPLHYAAKNGRGEAAAYLIESGVDINARNVMGQTAYNVAVEFKQDEGTRMLIEKKADRGPLVFPRLEGDYLGQEPPGETPVVFGLGFVSSIWGLHSTVVFSPDGNTALWTPMVLRPGAIYSTGIIYMMTRESDRWSAPRTAPFSGKFDDDVPFFAPDGKRLFFISSRPLPSAPGSRKERIWAMDRTDEGWAEPRPLDPVINDMQMHWQFSVDGKGSLYFSSTSPDGFGGGDVYFSRFEDGHYLKPENCGTGINTEQDEGTPFIAPGGGYLLFERSLDLYISFRRPDGEWTQARSLGTPINGPGNELCPVVSPDGKYLFFVTTRGGENQAFWVDAGIIERMRGEILR
jgi:ankyrin repeat protein